VAGIPKSLRDYDLDVDEPFDVDDEDMTASNFLTGLPGEPTEISGFISICKLSKILSQILEILYTTTDRRRAVAKMTHMQRLLNQWNDRHIGRKPTEHSSKTGETGRHLRDVYEQLLYHYCKWLLHRPALSFPTSTLQYKQSLRVCAEAGSAMISTAYQRPGILSFILTNPGAHSYSIWSAGVTVLFQYWDLQSRKISTTQDMERLRDETNKACDECVIVLNAISKSAQPGSQDRLHNLEDLIRTTCAIGDGSNVLLERANVSTSHPDGSVPAVVEASALGGALDPQITQTRNYAEGLSDMSSLFTPQGESVAISGCAINNPDADPDRTAPFDVLDDFNLDGNELFGSEWFPLGFSPEKVQLETFDLMQGAAQSIQYGDKRQRIS